MFLLAEWGVAIVNQVTLGVYMLGAFCLDMHPIFLSDFIFFSVMLRHPRTLSSNSLFDPFVSTAGTSISFEDGSASVVVVVAQASIYTYCKFWGY